MRHPSPGALLKAPTSVQTAYIFLKGSGVVYLEPLSGITIEIL